LEQTYFERQEQCADVRPRRSALNERAEALSSNFYHATFLRCHFQKRALTVAY
jgi:hypothetical protein